MNPATDTLHIVPGSTGEAKRRAPSRRRSPFGGQLQRLRRAAGLTQQELARRAGYSAVYIGMLERGERAPLAATIDLLAAALALQPQERAALHAAARGSGDQPSALHLNTAALAPLVGRERELAALDRLLGGAGPSALLLSGEPGIGKTRLLYEAVGRGAARGWTVLQAGCQRAGAQESFAPLLEAIDRHVQAQPPRLVRTQLEGCTWLRRVLPDLAAFDLDEAPVDMLPPERERRLVLAAAMRFIDNVAGPAGTLLVLDDLQWAGPDALDLLVALLRTPRAAPVRIAAAYRSTEVQSHDALAVALHDLSSLGLAEPHALAHLEPDGAQRLLDNLLAGRPEVGVDLRERLLQRSGGVPFFIVSCAQSLFAADGVNVTGEVPWNLAQSIRQRVAVLPPSTRAVLDTAAVIGRRGTRRLLMAGAGQPEDAVLDAIEALCRARLMEEEDKAYCFAHDVIHEVVASDLSAARRMVVHRRVAEALERLPSERSSELIAFHYLGSDTTERAWPYLEAAGDEARAAAAHATAERHYRALVNGLGDGVDAAAARAHEKLGAALLALDRYAEAIAESERAAALYRALGALDDLGRTVAQIGHAQGRRGTPDAGIARIQEVLSGVPALGNSSALPTLYVTLAHLFFLSGRYAEQLTAATQAAAQARAVDDTRLLTIAEDRRGTALFSLGRLDEALPVLHEADRLAATVTDLEVVWRVHTNIGLVYFARGDFERLRDYAERAVQTARRLGDPLSIARTLSNRGEGALYRGEWAQARSDFMEALRTIEQIGETEATAYPLLDLAQLCLLEGRWAELARYADAGLALGERSGDLQILRWGGGLLAERDIQEGSAARAVARFAPLLDRGAIEETDVTYILPVYAWACLEAGERTRAAELAAAAVRRARANDQRVVLVDALRVSGLVACAEARWSAAVSCLDEALSMACAMPYPYAEARLWHVYAEAHLADGRSGDLDAASSSLRSALAIYDRLGARADAQRARHDLVALPYVRHLRAAGIAVSRSRWARVQAALPPLSRHGRPRADDLRTVAAILYVLRTDCPWAKLPPEFGDDATAHRRYRQWQTNGVWPRLASILGTGAR